LQTSPEFAMKRLLAAGSGSIFQISKAFRNGELGRYHNPEFTLLEWYRVGFSLTDLMNEIDQLFTLLFDGNKALEQTQRYSYSEIFKHHTGLNPLDFSYQDYCVFALDNQLTDAGAICGQDHTLWLDLLFSHYVQPCLGKNSLCMIYGYPACQSSLARLNVDNNHITDRVELFMNGIELGNGYFELIDACEQEQRFDKEVLQRHNAGQAMAVKDHRLINAMKAGLPECSGMAIGLDRLLMILCEKSAISDVLAFPIGHA
jgi:elongation factor P--(R)-beta-lysine ligase